MSGLAHGADTRLEFQLQMESDIPLREDELLLALGLGDGSVADVGGDLLAGRLGGGLDRDQLVLSEMHRPDHVARVVSLRSAGGRGHSLESSGTTPNQSSFAVDNPNIESSLMSSKTTLTERMSTS